MDLRLSTWPEVEAYLHRSRGILVPIGSTEQHGPTGLIGTDALAAEAVALRAGELADALVGPVIPVGMAQHHMAFPGTVTLRPSTLLRLVRDYVLSLAEHGLNRFFFVNGHGGNVATVTAAFYEVEAEVRGRASPPAGEAAAPRCKLVNWYEGTETTRLRKELFGEAEGAHATPSEVSVVLALHPDQVREADMSPRIAPAGPFQGAAHFRQRHPDGRMGSDPTLARAEHGSRLIETAAADVARAYRQFLSAD
jgi:creatinine amidohydrolase